MLDVQHEFEICEIFVRKFEQKRLFRKPRHGKGNIKVDVKEVASKDAD